MYGNFMLSIFSKTNDNWCDILVKFCKYAMVLLIVTLFIYYLNDVNLTAGNWVGAVVWWHLFCTHLYCNRE